MIYAIMRNALSISIIVMIMFSCGNAEEKEPAMKSLDIKSSAFNEGEMIPVKYTCDSINVSAPLSWSDPPEGTRSLALICDDPDAPRGTWVHWVLFNMPPDITELPEGVAVAEEEKLSGAVEGINDFGRTAYGGPCPPPGPAHRYYFKIHALDKKLELKSDAKKADLEKAMNGHILAKGQLMGKYKR